MKTRRGALRSPRTLALNGLALLFVAPVTAQEIDVRLSIKYILGADGVRPTGFYGTEQNVRDVITATNRAMQRWGRGYRFVITEFQDVTVSGAPGSAAFSTISPLDEIGMLEDAAEMDPVGYHWRTNATNIYIADCCAAAAAIPEDDVGREIVYFSADVNLSSTDPGQNARQTIWAHEIGHHFDLIHPWADDRVADTQSEPTPSQCTGPIPPQGTFPCALGGSDECCCSSKVANLLAAAQSNGWSQQEHDDLRYNVMGYMGAVDCALLGEDVITIDTMRLTDGQLDRWTDASRRHHADDTTGLTHFVDEQATSPFNGYSGDPYLTVSDGLGAADSLGGDIVLIRAGTYVENLILDHPVTLRASRGAVILAKP